MPAMVYTRTIAGWLWLIQIIELASTRTMLWLGEIWVAGHEMHCIMDNYYVARGKS